MRVACILFMAFVVESVSAQGVSEFQGAFGESPPIAGQTSIEYSPLGTPRSNVDLMLGTVSGGRLQYRLGASPDSPWAAEGVAGFLLIFPTAGAGVRYRGLIHQGPTNTFSIEPGANLYAFYLLGFEYFSSSGSGGAALGVDVDFLWRHRYGETCDGVVGLKLGAAGAVVGEHGVLMPVVSFVGGLRF